ncbi:MAG: type VII secretion integral membrane protein EccD [Micromonosporaceae bacterium]|nr:type VII secretion integral membrane protein EccD [Micromonosporaceae bacterium]
MSAPTSGLARLTIRAPRRSLDLAIPYQVPLAELLPEVLRRAGEAGGEVGVGAGPSGGWVLRRGDGTSLRGEVALAHQGVRDGDILYLVPRHLTWPEPQYDDVVEEIAEAARAHGRTWDATATRVISLVAAGLVLITGLGTLLAVGPPRIIPALAAAALAGALLAVGALLAGARGAGGGGGAAAGMGLPYAAAAGVLFALGDASGLALTADALLVGSCALLLAAALGAVGVGHGLRVFVGGATLGLAGLVGALLGLPLSGPSAAAILVVVLVAAIGLAPLLAVRLGRLPLPVVTASPQILAAERRPARPEVLAAVVRADEILVGSLTGIAVASGVCVAMLTTAGGIAAPLLGGLVAVALLLRARLFPAVAARLPLLVGGLVGLALTAAAVAAASASATRLLGVALAFAAVVALISTAATASRRRTGPSPYLGRLADILDVTTVVALAPVACAVLDLFTWVRELAG